VRLGSWQFLETERIADDPVLGPLLVRHKIVKGPAFGLCVHELRRSDYDRALHDHPWWFVSLVLRGGYWEEYHLADVPRWGDPFMQDGVTSFEVRSTRWRGVGSVAFRPARWRHKVRLLTKATSHAYLTDAEYERSRLDPDRDRSIPAWTLILMGPRVRRWGFWVDGKWCWWRRHDPARNICADDVLHTGGGD